MGAEIEELRKTVEKMKARNEELQEKLKARMTKSNRHAEIKELRNGMESEKGLRVFLLVEHKKDASKPGDCLAGFHSWLRRISGEETRVRALEQEHEQRILELETQISRIPWPFTMGTPRMNRTTSSSSFQLPVAFLNGLKRTQSSQF